MFQIRNRTSFIAVAPLLFLLSFSVSCINAIGEPIQKASNETKTNLMDRKTAKDRVTVALFAATANCPFFYESGYNPSVNWGMMLGSSQKTTDSFNLTGNANNNFVEKQNVQICLLSLTMLRQACDLYGNTNYNSTSSPGASAILSAHFFSFAVCAAALKSDMSAPMVFM